MQSFMATRVYESSKDLILESAMRVISSGGMNGFTMDAVIAESGLSKAGVFYNYKTKQDLTLALAEKLTAEWAAHLHRFEAEDKNPVGRKLRAYIHASAEYFYKKGPEADRNILLTRSFFELFFAKPDLLRALMKKVHCSLPFLTDEGISREQGMVIYFALDGLWLQAVSPHFNLSRTERKRAIDLLLKLTKAPINVASLQRGSR